MTWALGLRRRIWTRHWTSWLRRWPRSAAATRRPTRRSGRTDRTSPCSAPGVRSNAATRTSPGPSSGWAAGSPAVRSCPNTRWCTLDGDLAVIVGFERGEVRIDGGELRPMTHPGDARAAPHRRRLADRAPARRLPAGRPAPVMTHLRAGPRRLARRLVLATAGAAAGRGRARGAHPDADRRRRPVAPRPPGHRAGRPRGRRGRGAGARRPARRGAGRAQLGRRGRAGRGPALSGAAAGAGAPGLVRRRSPGSRCSTCCRRPAGSTSSGWSTRRGRIVLDPDAAMDGWAVTDPADRAWVRPRLRPHPVRALSDPLPAGPAAPAAPAVRALHRQAGRRQLRRVRRGRPHGPVLAFRRAARRPRRHGHRPPRPRRPPGLTITRRSPTHRSWAGDPKPIGQRGAPRDGPAPAGGARGPPHGGPGRRRPHGSPGRRGRTEVAVAGGHTEVAVAGATHRGQVTELMLRTPDRRPGRPSWSPHTPRTVCLGTARSARPVALCAEHTLRTRHA